MTIGTPPQTFTVLLDTASAYIFIPSTQCDHSCWGAYRFDGSKSSTFTVVPTGAVSQTSRGTIVDGVLCAETIALGPFSADNVTFVLANAMRQTTYERFEGLVVRSTQGLGFPELNNNIPTFIDKLMEQGLITQRVFCIYLSTSSFIENQYDQQSQVVIGEVDTQFADGELEYIPLSGTPAFWSVKLGDVTVGARSITQNTGIAIFDSATPTIVVPNTYWPAMFEALNAERGCGTNNIENYVCDCKEFLVSDYPTFSLILGKSTFTLEPERYLLEKDGVCKLLMKPGDAPYWVLGHVFLRKYYTVYDMDQARIGLALASSSSQAVVLALFCLILA